MILTLFLALAALAGLVLTVFGLPGLWLFLLLAAGLKAAGVATGLTWGAWLVGIALAFAAELVEWVVSLRYTTRLGGSRRAGWGAIAGGLLGAVVGLPVPVIGSVLGSFLGSFLGALAAEYSATRDTDLAGRVAWGALIGRTVATAIKIMLGVVIAAVVISSAWG